MSQTRRPAASLLHLIERAAPACRRSEDPTPALAGRGRQGGPITRLWPPLFRDFLDHFGGVSGGFPRRRRAAQSLGSPGLTYWKQSAERGKSPQTSLQAIDFIMVIWLKGLSGSLCDDGASRWGWWGEPAPVASTFSCREKRRLDRFPIADPGSIDPHRRVGRSRRVWRGSPRSFRQHYPGNPWVSEAMTSFVP
jgi:hypothetical protein